MRHALTVVDVASRYKEAEPLTSKTSTEVTAALSRIYSRGPLKWPKLLEVDRGRECMGNILKGVEVRRGDTHRSQAIIERLNCTLAERLFGHQYVVEMKSPNKRSTEWDIRLPAVVAALNNEVTRLIGKKPSVAIKA